MIAFSSSATFASRASSAVASLAVETSWTLPSTSTTNERRAGDAELLVERGHALAVRDRAVADAFALANRIELLRLGRRRRVDVRDDVDLAGVAQRDHAREIVDARLTLAWQNQWITTLPAASFADGASYSHCIFGQSTPPLWLSVSPTFGSVATGPFRGIGERRGGEEQSKRARDNA